MLEQRYINVMIMYLVRVRKTAPADLTTHTVEVYTITRHSADPLFIQDSPDDGTQTFESTLVNSEIKAPPTPHS